MSDVIARAIAAAIALGRKEARPEHAAAVRAKAAVNLLKPVLYRFSVTHPTEVGRRRTGITLTRYGKDGSMRSAIRGKEAEEPTWQTRDQPERRLFRHTSWPGASGMSCQNGSSLS
jgi:hypothetical protein